MIICRMQNHTTSALALSGIAVSAQYILGVISYAKSYLIFDCQTHSGRKMLQHVISCYLVGKSELPV